MTGTTVITAVCWCCGEPAARTVPTWQAHVWRRGWRCPDCFVLWDGYPDPPDRAGG